MSSTINNENIFGLDHAIENNVVNQKKQKNREHDWLKNS